MNAGCRLCLLLCCTCLVWLSTLSAQPPQATPAQLEQFEKQVFPILQKSCLKCHGGEAKIKGGLRLTSREAIMKGGDTGPALEFPDSSKSLLLKAIHHQDGLEMPPSGKLPAEQLKILEAWIKAGAPWSEKVKVESKTEHKQMGGVVNAEAKNFWAYRPVAVPAVPTVADAAWVKTPIDAFILAKLETKQLKPNIAADRLALIRRATYDLTGLPPTPEEIDTFVNHKDPASYEKLIDRLLASPHYGEKWGRHWLDVVRYAETNGYERDGPKPFAWRFRDYVIKSLNDDKPYDQFVREQLAGDELPDAGADAIIATGYYRLGLWDDEPADPKQARFDELDDYVATTSQAFLGMTMNCARCHDHKIDPIPQVDYYRMVAFFADVERFSLTRDVRSPYNLTDITPATKRKEYEAEFNERQKKLEKIKNDMTSMEDVIIKRMPEEEQRASEGLDRPQVIKKLDKFWNEKEKQQYSEWKQDYEKLKKKPEPTRELALSVNRCKVVPPQTNVMVRGSPHSPGAPVTPGFPAVLTDKAPSLAAPAKDARTSGRRKVLADWIASKENVLTARVMVNRVWQHHMGRGIVATANDFGKFGTLPSHPELLDWLASDFMQHDWKLKRLHKLIMMSNIYQTSSIASPERITEAARRDPENTLYWRFNPRRLTAEEVRDSMLAVNGTLNLKMAGPSVYPVIPKEVLAGQSIPGDGWGKSTPQDAARRSIYVYVKRSLQVPILTTHDQADPDSSCPVRYTTTVPTQALGMLNSAFTNEQAEALASRITKEHPNDVKAQLSRGIRLTTGRHASDAELQRDQALLDRFQTQHKMTPVQALKQLALLYLNANEFVYLD